MRVDFIMLVIFILASIARAEPVQCSCSEIKVAFDCKLMHFGCSWDDAAETCSELACDKRQPVDCTSTVLSYTNNCELYGDKCQNRKATCAEHEYIQDIYKLCKSAKEGHCQLDTAAGSNKCKKLDTPITCASYDENLCKYVQSLESSSSPRGYCYFDDTKAGTEAEPKCLNLPTECSERTQISCETATTLPVQCVWKMDKCQAKMCADLPQGDCNIIQKGGLRMEYCQMIEGTCTEIDSSKLGMLECLSKSSVTHHFDGSSCQPCKVLDSFSKYDIGGFMTLILVMIY